MPPHHRRPPLPHQPIHHPPHHPHQHPIRTRHHHLDNPQQPTPTHPRRMRPHHPLARPHLHHHMETIPTTPHPPQPPRPTTRPRTTTVLTPGIPIHGQTAPLLRRLHTHSSWGSVLVPAASPSASSSRRIRSEIGRAHV